MAKCTNVTYIMMEGATTGTFEKLIDITEYPDLGGPAEKLDATTLSDKKKRYINGIEDSSELEFKAWYEKESYEKLLALKDTLKKFRVYFGEGGTDGIWEWEGKLELYPNSGGVNAVREMTFSISDEGEEALHYVTSA